MLNFLYFSDDESWGVIFFPLRKDGSRLLPGFEAIYWLLPCMYLMPALSPQGYVALCQSIGTHHEDSLVNGAVKFLCSRRIFYLIWACSLVLTITCNSGRWLATLWRTRVCVCIIHYRNFVKNVIVLLFIFWGSFPFFVHHFDENLYKDISGSKELAIMTQCCIQKGAKKGAWCMLHSFVVLLYEIDVSHVYMSFGCLSGWLYLLCICVAGAMNLYRNISLYGAYFCSFCWAKAPSAGAEKISQWGTL